MARLFRTIMLMALVLCAKSAFAGTFYIAATGSDSNNGTTKATPWLHAPGMPSCTGSCSSHTPAAGDQFIFRGGDTWHRFAGTPAFGGQWTMSQSGTSSNPIYYGVDVTWFAGSSFARPIINQDNPLSTSNVSSCSHDGSNSLAVAMSGNWLTLDNFEFTGFCWSGSPSFGGHTIEWDGSNETTSNTYIHGWTHTSGAIDEAYTIFGANGSANQTFTQNIVDGSDSSPNSNFVIYYTCTNITFNVFRHVSNPVVCISPTQVHDNLFEYVTEPFDGSTHGNVVEWDGDAGPIYVYNNVVRHTNVAVIWWPEVKSGSTMYFYNNVMYDIGDSGQVNCVNISGGGGSGMTLNFYNNTIVGSCSVRFATNSVTPCFNGTANFHNNHFIGYSAIGSVTAKDSGCNPTISESTDLYQSAATAAAQGYVASGTGYCANETTPCAPVSLSNATVEIGTNQTSSCSSFGSALCSDTTDAVSRTSGNGGFTASFPAHSPNARPSSGFWDVGAYQWTALTGTRPNPPTGLQATVQ